MEWKPRGLGGIWQQLDHETLSCKLAFVQGGEEMTGATLCKTVTGSQSTVPFLLGSMLLTQ